jgi:hypothetical protein
MRDAVRLAIEDHHRNGFPVAIWQEGRVVWLHSDGSIQPADETKQTAHP